jgi:hypothetical protein
VHPLLMELGDTLDQVRDRVRQALVARGLLAAGAVVVVVNISDDLTRVDANFLRIQRI